MAPLPKLLNTPSIDERSNEISFPVDTAALSSLVARLLQAAESLSKRSLGPTQSQSVGMAVGLSIAGIVVAIFVFGWVRHFAAREHQKEAERRKDAEAAAQEEKAASEGGDPPAEEPVVEEEA